MADASAAPTTLHWKITIKLTHRQLRSDGIGTQGPPDHELVFGIITINSRYCITSNFTTFATEEVTFISRRADEAI